MSTEKITIYLGEAEVDALRGRATGDAGTAAAQLRTEWRRGREAAATAAQLTEIEGKLQKQTETLQKFADNMQKLILVLQKRS